MTLVISTGNVAGACQWLFASLALICFVIMTTGVWMIKNEVQSLQNSANALVTNLAMPLISASMS
jgi:hypothetical protein